MDIRVRVRGLANWKVGLGKGRRFESSTKLVPEWKISTAVQQFGCICGVSSESERRATAPPTKAARPLLRSSSGSHGNREAIVALDNR